MLKKILFLVIIILIILAGYTIRKYRSGDDLVDIIKEDVKIAEEFSLLEDEGDGESLELRAPLNVVTEDVSENFEDLSSGLSSSGMGELPSTGMGD